MSVNRRDFLRRAAGVSVAALSTTLPESKVQAQPSGSRLPSPESSGIEHIVVVMMENRSFDHLLGWMPNANGRQAGLSNPDNNGNLQPTHRLNYHVGCSHPDPDHSYAGGRSEYDGGNPPSPSLTPGSPFSTMDWATTTILTPTCARAKSSSARS